MLRLRFPLALVMIVLVAATASGQRARNADNDPDLAEIAAYRLTTTTLQKVSVATQAFGQALQADPKFRNYAAARKELTALQAKDDATPADEKRIAALEQQLERMSESLGGKGDAKTLGDLERKVGALPHMSESLAKAGLTPREYAKFTMAMLQAGMVAGMKKAGQLKQIPPGISPENVQFMLDHEAEIAALSKQMDVLGK